MHLCKKGFLNLLAVGDTAYAYFNLEKNTSHGFGECRKDGQKPTYYSPHTIFNVFVSSGRDSSS